MRDITSERFALVKMSVMDAGKPPRHPARPPIPGFVSLAAGWLGHHKARGGVRFLIHWLRAGSGPTTMTFEREMELFFMRNCYFEKEQQLVRNAPAYRLAQENDDATLAQEIATRILEASVIRP